MLGGGGAAEISVVRANGWETMGRIKGRRVMEPNSDASLLCHRHSPTN